MTTTSTFQGMGEDTKPSSRVLQPPGGGSSNIFGSEPVQRGSGSRPKSNDIFGTGPVEPTDEHRGKRRGGPSDNSRDNVFGGSTVNDSGANTRAENKRRGQGEEFPEYDRSVYAAHRNPQRRNIKQGAFNPITGEPIESPQKTMEAEEEERRRREAQRAQERGDGGNQPPKQAPHTSSRVLAPPGGKSSGPLW